MKEKEEKEEKDIFKAMIEYIHNPNPIILKDMYEEELITEAFGEQEDLESVLTKEMDGNKGSSNVADRVNEVFNKNDNDELPF
jgi:hypothetical protein|tara:strand:- start:814 stop:1062 length:249 start_codon:yes stop_codon:yes gene_type:complete